MSRQLKLNDFNNTEGNCVLYVMSRDQRLNDNHALLVAQKIASKNKVALVVMFNLMKVGVRSREHYQFMIDGLKKLEKELEAKNISFVIKIGESFENINDTVSKYKPIEIIFDFNPMRGPRALQKKVANKIDLPASVVDTHNIIPCWVLSDKEEYAAHTIRSKVHKKLDNWLIEPIKPNKHSNSIETENNNWKEIDRFVGKIEKSGITLHFKSGEDEASKALKNFINTRLKKYDDDRNIPTTNGQSNLSPYLHFGQISSLRIALEIIKTTTEAPLLYKKAKLASHEGEAEYIDHINAYLEEVIVRKELADNFVFYNQNYDNLDGAKDWARQSLENHKDDPREHIYNLSQFENAQTHSESWNAAQNELRRTGKLHGYMRMYWAKKILEWSINPEKAIETSIYLNDHYSIDGGDPNGYTGIMWSIAGIHDRPWFEREVYGKIRYMNDGGLKRRFDLDKYIQTLR